MLYAIYKDVIRTRGTMEFFRDASLQCMLIRILYTYSKAHPEISYNQGMGELAATIVYLLHTEQWPSQLCSSPVSKATSLNTSTSSIDHHDARHTDIDESSYVYVDSFIDIQEETTYLSRNKFLSLTPFSGNTGIALEYEFYFSEYVLILIVIVIVVVVGKW